MCTWSNLSFELMRHQCHEKLFLNINLKKVAARYKPLENTWLIYPHKWVITVRMITKMFIHPRFFSSDKNSYLVSEYLEVLQNNKHRPGGHNLAVEKSTKEG